MAALPVPMPAAPPAPCSGSAVALTIGLVALISGGALLLVGLLQSDSSSHALEVPRTAMNRAASVRFDAGQDAPGITKDSPLRVTAMSQPDTNNHSGLATANDHNRVAQSGPGTGSSDLEHKARRPRNCASTNAESAHSADLPLCQDPRDALAAMAAAQHRRAWTRRDGTAAYVATWAGSEDRIANALSGHSQYYGSSLWISEPVS